MKICSLSSGSKGNAIFVQSNKSKFLIDCGLSGKALELLLNSIGENPRDLNAIFVTHEHIDHIKGVGVLSRRYDLPILANEKTWLAMRGTIGTIAPKNIIVFKSNTFFSFRDVDVHAISTYHDAADPVSFIFYQKDKKITIMTDTGIVTDQMKSAIKGSKVLLLEANHDLEMLKNGPYPYHLKQRILSDFGHLSNDTSKQVLEDVLTGVDETVILGHLSDENNLEDLAFKEVHDHLSSLGLIMDRDVKLRVAPKLRADNLIDLGD
ncbi:MAG: MBL fold metallo-hydrolase [Tissierellia bacterium]|nr:MBL fold metallo-hydrolase [Tissierellia bacterium]